MSNFRNRQSAEILGSVYKNAEMAYEASGEVLKHCANRKLAGEISAQRDRYRDVAAQARTEIVRRGGVPREYSGYAKMMSRMGIAMKTANNRSSKNPSSNSLLIMAVVMQDSSLLHRDRRKIWIIK